MASPAANKSPLFGITRGLTTHCDLLLSNNLQVNWPTGRKFHMMEHLETVACTDDPAIHQQPPPAPLDTLIGVGTGRYNNFLGCIAWRRPGSGRRQCCPERLRAGKEKPRSEAPGFHGRVA
jgi:hypothetical protein